MIRVLIVDDHTVVRSGLSALLLAFDDLDVAGAAGDALFTEKFTTEMTAGAFTMHVDLGPMVVHATYKLDGSVSKNMSPPGMPGQPDIEVTSRATWQGKTLVVTSTSASPSANGPVTVTSTRKFWLDDKGRIMVFATHNTDNGDGWEWEGNNHYYFEHFSEKISYPLGINIVFYVMTH